MLGIQLEELIGLVLSGLNVDSTGRDNKEKVREVVEKRENGCENSQEGFNL